MINYGTKNNRENQKKYWSSVTEDSKVKRKQLKNC